MKKYEVAVGHGITLKCRMVDETEYKALKLESEKEINRKEKEIIDLHRQIDNLEIKLSMLEKEISKLKGED